MTRGYIATHHVYKWIDSPVGRLKLVGHEAALSAILWAHEPLRRVRLPLADRDDAHPVLRAAEQQLAEYFQRQRQVFALPLDLAGTPFQRRVWNALLAIPFGEVRTYAQIAAAVDHPQAVRAVGAAIGRNPVSIVAPCHRVVGARGALTGFAGGLPNKGYLLTLEGINGARGNWRGNP